MSTSTLATDERCDLLLTMIRSGGNESRERALRVGAETLPEALLVSFLREEADDVLRNSALEMLRLRGRRSFAAAVSLLEDEDDDVVLQGVLLLESIGDPRAWSHLRPLLTHRDENIAQAVITAAARLGSRGTAIHIIPCLRRGLWMQLAAVTTLGQLRSRRAVPPLRVLLEDPDVRDLAAEALARIGGTSAARALAQYWQKHQAELDNDIWLPLLAQSLEELDGLFRAETLRACIARNLGPDRTGVAAAEAILSLGAGDEDGRAIDILVAAKRFAGELPRCLDRRADLIEWLIGAPVPARDWGYELVRRNPSRVPPETLRRALLEALPGDPELARSLIARVADAKLLVELHVRFPGAHEVLAPLIRKSSASSLTCIAGESLTLRDRILLMDAAGGVPNEIVTLIEQIERDEIAPVVTMIGTRAVLARLPWSQWIESDPAFAALLGVVVERRNVRELLPLVRSELRRTPLPELISAAGALRDRASLKILVGSLAGCALTARPAAFEAIASVGGEPARAVLLEHVQGSDPSDVRLAARAFARHAAAGDAPILRELGRHPDWAVRYAAAEVLGRFPTPENHVALSALATDSAVVVATRARKWLNASGNWA